VERIDLLRGDHVRLGGAASAGLALDRLDRDASRAAPLWSAGSALAALTRARFALLAEPLRGDEALAAALERCTPADPGQDDRGTRRLRAVPYGAAPDTAGGSRPTRPPRVTPPDVAAARSYGRVDAPAVDANRRPRPARGERRASPDDAPTPPPGFEDAAAARGLEWLADRVAGGAEAAATPLALDGGPGQVPELRSTRHGGGEARGSAAPAAPAPTRADRPDREGMPVPVPGTRPVGRIERALEPRRGIAVEPAALPALRVYPPERPGELEALVRTWGAGPAAAAEALSADDASRLEERPWESGGIAARGIVTTRRSGIRPVAAVGADREDDAAKVGDVLGRVLVAELRRYGIEVDQG